MEFPTTVTLFYKLKEDYSCESALYPEEVCFLPAGT